MKINIYDMRIICRRLDKKIVEPSSKGRLLTKWNDGDPIEQFEAVERVKLPLAVTDVEIKHTWHEITKQRAAKLYEQKNGPVVEEPTEPKSE
jgi:hypothetical protein